MGILTVLVAAVNMLTYVLSYWCTKLITWHRRRSPVQVWLSKLRTAESFEDWEAAALQLDSLLGLDLWRANSASRHYDYRLIHERLSGIEAAREAGDIHALVNLVRSGLVRNLGNITAPKLFNHAFAGTKLLIDEYITQVAEVIEDMTALPTTAREAVVSGVETTTTTTTTKPHRRLLPVMSAQAKLDLIHDTRLAFGRSTLVLQGGAIFGLCHLGVIKALFLRGLLPRIITGTATGAVIAAIVAIHPEEELPNILRGDGIDLSAFAGRGKEVTASGEAKTEKGFLGGGLAALVQRFRRFQKDGYLLDSKLLEECVRANVGDITFQEAYLRSKRVLNITVATAGQGGVPTLLNHITAPDVLVWTAAVASNAPTPSLTDQSSATKILCKGPDGQIMPWEPAHTVDFKHWTHASQRDLLYPLLRTAELFNVNHFIVSQARPYLIPFLQSDMHGSSLSPLQQPRSKSASLAGFVVRMVGFEIRHRLRQLDTLGILPPSIRRFLVDETMPGASMTLVPDVDLRDFARLLELPSPRETTLEYWIRKGERSAWPAVAALRIRCAVEMELDRAYQMVRALKAEDLRRKDSALLAAGSSWPAVGGLGVGVGVGRQGPSGQQEVSERNSLDSGLEGGGASSSERDAAAGGKQREQRRERAQSTGARAC
ncbi:hypothetical protein QBC47DRAFT_55542 [Echria macrotheca]|uniref:PNPLA domain-containing protein n=1 Tax=Echria macrotheca TaxID=438768 RepID=A0AAJ0F2H7_9PEZI|nr:hypothetical protein QBC47DRAFT_55542 [Echria macrotheca]